MRRNENPAPTALRGRRRASRAQDEHIIDPYRQTRKLSEPSYCGQCGAVYRAGRWKWGPQPEGAQEVLCQACHRINDKYPAGVVTLTGSSALTHSEEITRLVRHQEESEKQEHPLNRIINIEQTAEGLAINTTDIHLPARIGKAIQRAFRGELEEHFDESGYFARVKWHRDN